LKQLVLIGFLCEKDSGTQEQMDLARAFFEQWFPGTIVIHGSPDRAGDAYDSRWQANFENLHDLGNLLNNILNKHRKSGYQDRDIIIDCTGGYKVTNIAAALDALRLEELMFQYVATGEHAGKITGFNVATETYQG